MKNEATQDGETAILVDHITEGQAVKDREGGEVEPKRPTVGKVKPGITF